jgi:staphylococcal nuclease domain-containing protein 1
MFSPSLTFLLKLWKDYDESSIQQEEEVVQEEDSSPAKPTYHDIIISDVRTHNGITFSVQILNTEGRLGHFIGL